MSVEVNGSGSAFEMGTPKALFAEKNEISWDVTSDGKRFLMSALPGGGGQTPITVVLNWQADLKR